MSIVQGTLSLWYWTNHIRRYQPMNLGCTSSQPSSHRCGLMEFKLATSSIVCSFKCINHLQASILMCPTRKPGRNCFPYHTTNNRITICATIKLSIFIFSLSPVADEWMSLELPELIQILCVQACNSSCFVARAVPPEWTVIHHSFEFTQRWWAFYSIFDYYYLWLSMGWRGRIWWLSATWILNCFCKAFYAILRHGQTRECHITKIYIEIMGKWHFE